MDYLEDARRRWGEAAAAHHLAIVAADDELVSVAAKERPDRAIASYSLQLLHEARDTSRVFGTARPPTNPEARKIRRHVATCEAPPDLYYQPSERTEFFD
jgi:hypothetical protein